MITFLSEALERTDARDSITEILQYSARLASGLYPSHEVASRRVYKSLSEGRKIFRLFRFVPEIKQLQQINDVDPLINRLAYYSTSAGVIFYVLDNLIYYLETVKRKSRGDIRPFKLIKNRVSMLRITIAITLTMLELRRSYLKPDEAMELRRSVDIVETRFKLFVRLWHESLRLWLTLHKLHLLSLFIGNKEDTVKVTDESRQKMDILPGIIGLGSAVTSLIRRTVLRSDWQKFRRLYHVRDY
jgi:hypothetical protein